MHTADAFPNDADGDDVDDTYQVVGFADTNADGVEDTTQGMCNLYDAEGFNVIGFGASKGQIHCYTSVANGTIPDGNLYADALHYGMFAFAIDGLPVNPQSPATVQVTVYLPEAAPALSGWYKFDQANGQVTDYSAYSSVQNGHLVLSLVDGGSGDQDGVVNGVIIDPSGPAIAAVPPPPPPPPPPDDGSGSGNDRNPAAQRRWWRWCDGTVGVARADAQRAARTPGLSCCIQIVGRPGCGDNSRTAARERVAVSSGRDEARVHSRRAQVDDGRPLRVADVGRHDLRDTPHARRLRPDGARHGHDLPVAVRGDRSGLRSCSEPSSTSVCSADLRPADHPRLAAHAHLTSRPSLPISSTCPSSPTSCAG